MPNGTNVIEIIVQARDQATQALERINASLAQLQPAATNGTRAINGFEAANKSAFGSVSQFATVTRLASATIVSELDPQLGSLIIRITTLSRLMRSTTSVMTGIFVGVGIAAVVTGLSLWIQKTNDTIDAQLKLERQIATLDVSGLQADISKLNEELERSKRRAGATIFGAMVEDLKNALDQTVGFTGSISDLTAKVNKAQEAFKQIQPLALAGGLAKLRAEQESLNAAIAKEAAARTRNLETFEALSLKQGAAIDRRRAEEEKELDLAEDIAVRIAQREIGTQEAVDAVRKDFRIKRRNAELAFERELNAIVFGATEQRKELLRIPEEIAERSAKAQIESLGLLAAFDKQRVSKIISDFNFEFSKAAIFRRPDVAPIVQGVDRLTEKLLKISDEQLKSDKIIALAEKDIALTRRLSKEEQDEVETRHLKKVEDLTLEHKTRVRGILQDDLETRRQLLEQALADQQQVFDDFFGNLRASSSDFFFNVMTGQLNSFADIWRNFWQSLSRQASNILSQLAFPTPQLAGGGIGGLPGLIFGKFLGGGGGGGGDVNALISLIEGAGGFVPLQHGGIVRRPTLAMLGEGGPEAVVPLGRGEGVGGVTVINLTRESDLQQVVTAEMARNREVIVNDVFESIKGNRQLRRTMQRGS